MPTMVAARSTNYPRHLKVCKFYKEAVATGRVRPPPTDDTLTIASFFGQAPSTGYMQITRPQSPSGAMSATDSRSSNVSSASSDKRQRCMLDYYDNIFSEEEQDEFERLLIQFQADNNLPDRFIEKKSTRRLFIFLNRASARALPNRGTLGGRILDRHSIQNELDQLQALRSRVLYTKGRVNFLSDVWMNIAKAHFLGCQLGLYGIISSYGLFPTGSRHDGLAIAEQMEKVMDEMESKGWQIGAVVTDNAGQSDRARRILALRKPGIAYLHCFAHDCNNLVKSVLNASYQTITKLASTVTVTLNQSSSKWLPRARSVIATMYGKPLGFINLCETRWNSMQGCFASLLRVRSALEQFAMDHSSDPEFPDTLCIFKEPTFWNELESAEKVIRPLSNASYKLQRDENTLADVVESYRDIYRVFCGNANNVELVSNVEKRWMRCEQPLMLLALFLHPRHVCLARAIMDASPHLRLYERRCGYGIYYYRRYVDNNDVGDLAREMHLWKHGRYFENPSFCRFSGDVGEFWSCAADIKFGCKLPKLAAVILSIAVNTATCERYFSELGAIHTAIKNRMDPDKARKFSLVRKAVREYDAAESGRKKRTELKRIVDPREREIVGDCVAPPVVTITEIEEGHVIADQEAPEPDTLEYWQDIFDLLEDEEYWTNDGGINEEDQTSEPSELQSLFTRDNYGSRDLQPAEELELQNQETNQKVFDGTDEEIPQPDTTPFPRTKTKNFPLEKKLTGIRGQKLRLRTLFSSEKTFGSRPYTEYEVGVDTG